MNVPFAVLADYCNISIEGKLNVMGVFDILHSPAFPCVHPAMQLVMSFEFPLAEQGKETPVEVQLMDDDGRVMFKLGTTITPKVGEKAAPGDPIRVNHVVVLNNLRFEKPGGYQFAILVRDDEKAVVRLAVRELASPPRAMA